MPNITPERLAEYIEFNKNKIPKGEIVDAQIVLRSLLTESLPKTEYECLKYLKYSTIPLTSRQIADHFGLGINRVGNVMGRLRRLGLVTGEAKSGADGLYYEWRVR